MSGLTMKATVLRRFLGDDQWSTWPDGCRVKAMDDKWATLMTDDVQAESQHDDPRDVQNESVDSPRSEQSRPSQSSTNLAPS
jgi:hypothetical protein